MTGDVGGTCRHCMKRREVYSVTRYGGGTYRRGGRVYRSSICLECATRLASQTSSTTRRIDRFDASRIRTIAEYGKEVNT